MHLSAKIRYLHLGASLCLRKPVDKMHICAYPNIEYTNAGNRKSTCSGNERDRLSPAESSLRGRNREVRLGAGQMKEQVVWHV